ncbi:MAG: EmrB/QacA family drug resistance transporter, partial [Pseudomonadota bacterium]|nr:EmrB/QacA family drug resistance transporter [Pseudomonadota bacterium]
MQPPYLPSQWDIFTVDGLRLLDAEIARQAMAIGFLNDFKLIFIGAVISVPLVVLLSRGRSKEAG